MVTQSRIIDCETRDIPWNGSCLTSSQTLCTFVGQVETRNRMRLRMLETLSECIALQSRTMWLMALEEWRQGDVGYHSYLCKKEKLLKLTHA